MPEYLTPLPRLLAQTLDQAARRLDWLDAQAATALADLEGRVVAVELAGLGITLFCRIDNGAMRVSEADPGRVDTTVRGSPISLAAMSAGSTATGRVTLSGDAEIGRRFQRFVSALDPDWEEPLARIFGDVLGHQLARGLRASWSWSTAAIVALAENASEYLREESRDLVSPGELEAFLHDVDTLREDSDRLAERVERLTATRGGRR